MVSWSTDFFTAESHKQGLSKLNDCHKVTDFKYPQLGKIPREAIRLRSPNLKVMGMAIFDQNCPLSLKAPALPACGTQAWVELMLISFYINYCQTFEGQILQYKP